MLFQKKCTAGNMSSNSSNCKNIIEVKIHYCDDLKSDILLLQPVLCMHVIDERTGTYLKKSDRNRAVVSFYENQRNDIDYIMPVMTQPCSISGEKLTLLSWEEDFILNEEYNALIDKESSIILFFEIIDLTPPSHSKQNYERLNQNGMHKIAWAFLKLLGSNGVVNTGSKLRLQLFKPLKPIKKNKNLDVEVYKWWLKKTRTPMKASLFISIEPHAIFTPEPALRSMQPLQQEKGSTTFEKLTLSNVESSLSFPDEYTSIPNSNQDSEIIWSRKAGEPCKIPRKKLLLLDTISCCQIVKFSMHGRILAVGCGNHEGYFLMLYQIPSGKLLYKVLAHTELIYDLDWSYNDKYLLSSSGDYSVKMWHTNGWSLKETFVHPSYVYNAKFHPTFDNLFATSCYDHIIRIWTLEKCQLLKELEAHNSTACSLAWNTSGTKLYSADGLGQIKVWGRFRPAREDSYCLEKEINPVETMGISINKIVPDFQKQTLCLFCCDSVARILCLESGRILSSYESDTSSPKLSKGCCSPCGSLLFLCCDKGNVSVWNKSLCNNSDSELLYDLNYEALSCIDYHPHEHMLASSFWDEGAPVYIYINEELGQKKLGIINDGDAKVTEGEKSDILKQSSLGKYLETHIDVTTHTTQKRHGPAKYKAYKFEETSLSGSMDMHLPKMQEDNSKQSLTAVITKSSQFDVIAVPDDSACSDSNEFRSLSIEPVVLNRSSKRSQRRRKLREMHKALL